jgi:hypothetical protein
MQTSSLPPEWYAMQAELSAQELDFELTIAACEATGTPYPETVQEEISQIYNFNAILDALDD